MVVVAVREQGAASAQQGGTGLLRPSFDTMQTPTKNLPPKKANHQHTHDIPLWPSPPVVANQPSL
eukprot:m.33718 g.33718  ORF g.33718 m.33718 type:complete len:65 (-) comp10491_c0_seq1:196-390(-)